MFRCGKVKSGIYFMSNMVGKVPTGNPGSSRAKAPAPCGESYTSKVLARRIFYHFLLDCRRNIKYFNVSTE